jgi:hypothetical protein
MTSSFQWTNGQIRARIADPFVIIGRMVEDEGRLDAFTMAGCRGRLAASGPRELVAQRIVAGKWMTAVHHLPFTTREERRLQL